MSDEAGLFSALNWYVHGIAEHSGIAIDLRASNKTLSDDHGLFKPRNPKGGTLFRACFQWQPGWTCSELGKRPFGDQEFVPV